MASSKNSSPVATVLYAGSLPNTKKLGAGETAREKVVRRLLRAAKALDKLRADPTTRPLTLDTYAKKYEGTRERLRAELLRATGAGEKNVYAPTNEFERAAFVLAGAEAPKAAKPKAEPKVAAPKRERKPKAKPAEAPAEAASEPAEAA